MRRYLVIANETVGGDDLVEQVRRRASDEQAAFHVVVPEITATETGESNDAAVAGGGPTSTMSFGDPKAGGLREPDSGDDLTHTDESRVLLGHVLDRLQPVAGEVTGEVGAPDPIEAARKAVAAGSYDEVILATPPAGASKLVAQDLPHRLERALDVPVTVVHAPRSDPRAAE
jgi:hypothetical protein